MICLLLLLLSLLLCVRVCVGVSFFLFVAVILLFELMLCCYPKLNRRSINYQVHESLLNMLYLSSFFPIHFTLPVFNLFVLSFSLSLYLSFDHYSSFPRSLSLSLSHLLSLSLSLSLSVYSLFIYLSPCLHFSLCLTRWTLLLLLRMLVL